MYSPVIFYYFQKYLAYPLETFFILLKRVVYIVFVLYFWRLVAEGSRGVVNFTEMLAYFLIGFGISDITMLTG